ncbi:MAG: restriction endonuclease [Candidatus Heimdallarchaeota archaeon]|nr:restriction endonuclease [Candidatus Heimdallarchaeota archaeon]
MTDKDSILERNPYLSLIAKISKIKDDNFAEDLEIDQQSNRFTNQENKIIEKLKSEKSLTKDLIYLAAVQSNCPLEKITKLISWYDFEKLTGKILDQAGWGVTTNFRYFGEGGQNQERHRYEVDVIAWKKPFVLLIDNKRHAKTSKSYLTEAVQKQQSRVYELFEMIPIIHDMKEIEWSKKWDKAILLPLIVTWREHGLIDIMNTPIIPSSMLFDLLTNLRLYFDERSWFHLLWEKI